MAVGDEDNITTLIIILAVAHGWLVPLFTDLLDQLV